ncbi:MAG: ABC transporter permease, partial [Clostridiales bacterium]|nr:ABC transporter permease [Clostridiales bacterium]
VTAEATVSAQAVGNTVTLGKSFESTVLYAYILLFILYISIMLYGQMIATSVATEKSSRAMELLISSAKPLNLMFGKVIGVGLAGLTQLALMIGSGFCFYKVNSNYWTGIPMVASIFQVPGYVIAFTVIFFILGYFLYSFMFGAIGSLTSRMEDISTSIMPIVLIYVASFMISVFGMMNPEAPFVKICSFVPFFTPTVMFIRITMSDVPPAQVAAGFAILVIFTGLVGYLAAKIYRMGVIMYGKAPKINELYKMLKQAKN